MSVGERIRLFRQESGLTQEQLHEKTGLATITIRQYEAGNRNPGIAQLEKLSKQLSISVNFFLSKQPFEDLNLLEIFKNTILHALNERRLYIPPHEPIGSITNVQYWRIIDSNIASITNIPEKNKLDIVYLDKKNLHDRTFSDVIKEIRSDNGWSQKELSKKLHISLKLLIQYENGEKIPTIEQISDYAFNLQLPFEYLYGVESKNAKKLSKALDEGDIGEFERLSGMPPGSIIAFMNPDDLESNKMDINISEMFDFFNKYKHHLSPEQQKEMLYSLNSIRKKYMDYKIMEKKYRNYHKNAQVLDKLVDLLSSSSPETQEKILQIIEIMAKEEPPTSD
ncbi:hypothetical protein CE91St36_03000 [Christensenellaceae bacterium]|nr:hypothetical protein CE91St36_03000 [Christensenellaceae bacterium]BDF60151.1 hypothetical protein CE91St37_03010 [Christensenellaceae bacterium]